MDLREYGRQGALEAVVLLLVAAIVAAVSWAVRPDPLPLKADPLSYELELSAPLVEMAEAMELFEAGDHLFIDTRPGTSSDTETIAGAFVIREASFDDDLLALMDDLYPEDPVILFGDGNLQGVGNVAGKLQGRGFESVTILRAGVAAWREGGGELSLPYFPETDDAWEDQ